MPQRKPKSKTREQEYAEAVAFYETLRTDFEHAGKILLLHLMEDARLTDLIHSGKHRTKTPEHLLEKLRRKGERVTRNTILKKVDDLVGVRLLHLHTQQMSAIDPTIRQILEQNHYSLLEQPVVYIWDIENKAFFSSIGIAPEERPEMYTSVHYVLSSAQRPEMRIELQVRTLMEEVWGEVSHSIDYPNPSKVLACREQLRVLARLTSGCSRLVDSIFATHIDATK